MMATEFITTNVIVAVIEIVTRLSPLPPILIDEQMAVATLRYGVKIETNFVGMVENGNVEAYTNTLHEAGIVMIPIGGRDE